MIKLYTRGTPNGNKLHIMLEELGLEYELIAVNLGKGEQRDPKFLKINPNGKIPAIVDTCGPGGRPLALAESGAILIYLGKGTTAYSARSDRAVRDAAVDHVPDGPCRSDDWAAASFHVICAYRQRVWNRAIPHGG